jgi:hypothetical protein
MAALSEVERDAARHAYRMFAENPQHPSLRFKKLAGHDALWSVRVTLSVRAVGHRDGETMVWFWIGTHAEFDRRFA